VIATRGSRVGDVGALALVDRALRRASRRAFLSRHEALTLLRDVVGGISDPGLGVTAASILEEALKSYDDALLVGRARVVDHLLDIRLALAG
jgi:hypothetical protein